MTFSYFANWHLPWHSVTSRNDIFHDIQLLRELTSSITFCYFANWHLPWQSVTSRNDFFHDTQLLRELTMFRYIQLLREPTELQKCRNKPSVQPSFKGAFVTHAQYARWCFWETMAYETQILRTRKELCNRRNVLEIPLEVEKTVGVTIQNYHEHTIPHYTKPQIHPTVVYFTVTPTGFLTVMKHTTKVIWFKIFSSSPGFSWETKGNRSSYLELGTWIIIMTQFYIFVNCNWVDTRWQ